MKTLFGTAALALVLTQVGPALANTDGEVDAFRQARVSLTQAIEKAEKQGKGKAVSVDFDTKNSVGLYEVSVVSGETVTRWDIDASNGKVASGDKETLATWLQKLGAGVKPEELTGSRTTLTQAVGLAEAQAGGKAIEADVEHSDNRLTYDIQVLNGAETRTIRIDSTNGQILANKS